MKRVSRQHHLRSATVLIVTIWIVLVLASLSIVFGQYVRVEAMAATNQASMTSAEMIANGAIQYAFAMLNQATGSGVSYASNPYEEVPLGDGFFWIMRPNLQDDRHYDFGLADEAAKINLNTASVEMLLKLPSMTAELANSIIDWRDSNQEISTGGAESEYYLLLEHPYYCKDAPLETAEEVLLVKGGDSLLLYGEDYNRNGVLDANENDAQASPPADNSNGKLDSGFFHYVTVYSAEPNVDAQGNPRINVRSNQNQSSVLELLKTVISEDQALLLMPRLRGRYANLIALYYSTGMSYEAFSKVIDKLTLTDDETVSGLVNVNTAPEKVLLCLPGLDQTDVDALIQERTKNSANGSTGYLWVTQALTREKAIGIGSYITGRSFQSAADITAVSGNGRAFCRYYVVIDKTQQPPRVLLRQPLHHLGWSLDPSILENLRNGKKIK
ncbi:MAG: general secretion pathway protein GspK [Planctomycetaceae bacterium]|nr:general secretion pathway protein GspK [Planctomycetaceae bacterium]